MSDGSTRSSRTATWIAAAFLGLFVVIGSVLAGYGLYTWLKVREVRSTWKTAEGRILSSKLTYDDEGASGTAIRYGYTVDGRQYESDNVRVGPDYSSSGSSDASALVERYPAGAACTVRYNPTDPAESVLVAESNVVMAILVGMGLAFACLPGVGLVVVLRTQVAARRFAGVARELETAGAGRVRLGRYRLDRGPGRLRVVQWPRPVMAAVAGAGLAAFLTIFVIAFLLRLAGANR